VTFLQEIAREIGLGCDVVEVGVAPLQHVMYISFTVIQWTTSGSDVMDG